MGDYSLFMDPIVDMRDTFSCDLDVNNAVRARILGKNRGVVSLTSTSDKLREISKLPLLNMINKWQKNLQLITLSVFRIMA